MPKFLNERKFITLDELSVLLVLHDNCSYFMIITAHILYATDYDHSASRQLSKKDF